jgi:hypothetical protein
MRSLAFIFIDEGPAIVTEGTVASEEKVNEVIVVLELPRKLVIVSCR